MILCKCTCKTQKSHVRHGSSDQECSPLGHDLESFATEAAAPWFRDLGGRNLPTMRRVLSLEQLRDAAAHTHVTAPEDYMAGSF